MDAKRKATSRDASIDSLLSRLHERLDSERARVNQTLEGPDAGTLRSDERSGPGDDSVEDHARDLACHQRQSLVLRLQLIDGALERLREGTYGRCAECEETIEARRLEHDPAAALCRDCQSSIDGETRTPTL